MTVLREKRLNELKESLNNWQEQTEQYREQVLSILWKILLRVRQTKL